MYSDNMLKNKPLIATAFIAMALAVTVPTFLVNNAAATPIKQVQGLSSCINSSSCFSGPPTGSIRCPDDSTVSLGQVFFSAQRDSKSGQIIGTFILTSSPQGFQLSVPITQAQISPSHFKLTGINNGFDLCSPFNPNLTPVANSLSGPCGLGVAVQYTSGKGEVGSINGVNVACTG
jgi:hypothetical protein